MTAPTPDGGDVGAQPTDVTVDGAGSKRSPEPDADCGGDCAEALRELERYLDGELPGAQLDDIRQHISDCYPCADRATFEEQVRALVRERCAERAPEAVMEKIRGHLREMAQGSR